MFVKMTGRTITCLGCVSLLLMSTGGVAQADVQAELQSLRAEVSALNAERQDVRQLREEVASLRSEQDSRWLDERRKEELKTLVRDVLADAETRASLMEGGATAGHDGKNFFLASDDGGFLLKIKGQIQVRYIAAFQDENPGEDDLGDPVSSVVDDEGETGFVIRRAKIAFGGHIADPRIKYAIQLAVDRGDNSVGADKIVIAYELMDGLTLWAGEDKAPFLREEITSSSKQLAVERSYVNEIFTMDKVQGAGAIYAADAFKAHVMVNDGWRSGDGGTKQHPLTQTGGSQVPVDDSDEPLLDDDDEVISFSRSSVSKDFNDDQTDFAITARLDYRITGDWKQMSDFVAWDGEEMAAFVGAAIHWEIGETGDSANNNDFFSWTIDGSLETQSFGVYGAIVGLHSDIDGGTPLAGAGQVDTAVGDQDLYGYLIQASFMVIPDKLEPFIRYEYIDFDEAYSSSYDEVSIVTVGANYYFKKHAAKFTMDVVWALDALPVKEEGLGLQVDDPDGDDQIVVRAQFQVLF